MLNAFDANGPHIEDAEPNDFLSRATSKAGENAAELENLVTEDSVALAFARQHKDSLRYCRKLGGWFLWTGSVWKLDETDFAYSIAREIGRRLCKDTAEIKVM